MYYLSYDDIIQIYSKVVEVSGGGFAGVLDTGKVKGILEQVKNDFYYPEIEDKLTYLFYSFGKYHCFTDGNKRIALAASIAFLNYNGYVFILSRFIREMSVSTLPAVQLIRNFCTKLFLLSFMKMISQRP